MGDGQHVWAAAEWVLMIRNCFAREEDDHLILCSGIPARLACEKSNNRVWPRADKFWGYSNFHKTPRAKYPCRMARTMVCARTAD